MRLLQTQERILELLTIFVTKIKGAKAMGRTDINHVSETVMAPLLSKIYGYKKLRCLNYTEYFNYPGIDLADDEAGVAIQVTASIDSEKIKDTLEKFSRHELYKKYKHLQVYILTEKQKSYSGKGYDELIQGKFQFDKDRDILDFRDLLERINTFQINEATKIMEILEADFGRREFSLFEYSEEKQTESAILNLLEVSFPKVLYQADIGFDRKEIIENSKTSKFRVYKKSPQRDIAKAALEQEGLKFAVDWEAHEKKIITFHDLYDDSLPLRKIIDAGTVTPIKPTSFFTINGEIDEDRERVFKSLLRRCLQQKLYQQGVFWQNQENLFIFGPDGDNLVREERWIGQKEGERTVFKQVMNKKEPEKTYYCQHFGFRVHFKRFDNRWYLLIMPDWFFSRDGYRRSFFHEDRVSGLKRMENTLAVYNHFRFVAYFLKNRKKPDLFDSHNHRYKEYPFLSFGDYVNFDDAPLLNDDSWNPPKAKEDKNAENAELQEDLQVSLF
ncbi:MAG: SMEK domain-containing protein [Acidobacteriota bacterium]|nr:SMEK domain-containing protein [Acidobacteriota bacterium]